MKKIILLSIAVSINSVISAQQIQKTPFNGKLLFLNSNSRPVGNVRIFDKANRANAVHTSSSGDFTLLYPSADIKPGMQIQLVIDTGIDNGVGLEVVDQNDLTNIIPLDPLSVKEIVVCRKGERDAAARALFKILKNSSDRERDLMGQRFTDLVRQVHKDYSKIAEMSKRLEDLSIKSDSLALYKEAYNIVSINTDKASLEVKKYVQLIRNGVSVRAARDVLDKLGAAKQLKQSTASFIKAVTQLETRVDASFSIYDLNDAIDCLDTLIHYGNNAELKETKLARWYLKKTDALYQEGDFSTALTECKHAIMLDSSSTLGNEKNLAGDFVFLSLLSKENGEFKNALDNGQKALAIYQKLNDPLGIAQADEAIGIAYQLNSNFRLALKYQLVANDITETVATIYSEKLVDLYSNIAMTYNESCNYSYAYYYEGKAIDISKHSGFSIKFAGLYNNLALVYLGENNPDTARVCVESALYIVDKSNSSAYPKVASIYKNYANILNQLRNYSLAMTYINKAIAIDTAVLTPTSHGIHEDYIIASQIKENLHIQPDK